MAKMCLPNPVTKLVCMAAMHFSAVYIYLIGFDPTINMLYSSHVFIGCVLSSYFCNSPDIHIILEFPAHMYRFMMTYKATFLSCLKKIGPRVTFPPYLKKIIWWYFSKTTFLLLLIQLFGLIQKFVFGCNIRFLKF